MGETHYGHHGDIFGYPPPAGWWRTHIAEALRASLPSEREGQRE